MSTMGFETARLTVRLGAVAANFRTIARMAGPAAVGAVVKANAYGLGMAEIARTLHAQHCDTFFVARLEEGVALRPVVPDARIFVLDGVSPVTVPVLQAHNLTPVLNSLAQIALWNAAAVDARKTLDAAIHIDTGMNRLGLSAIELSELAKGANVQLKGLRVVLWMSHLTCADDSDSPANMQQLEKFKNALAMLPPGPASLASTGGVQLGRDYAFDMVRPGIGLYGGNPQSMRVNPFETVALMTGRVLQMRRIDTGESVGYGASWRAGRPSVLATVAAGHADGLLRALGNRGNAAIGGVRVPIAGRVSMDIVVLDVTDLPDGACAVGTDAEFFGRTIALEEIAASASTANYEILTSVGPRVVRVYEGGPHK